ncbi:hypothetical protein [Natronococcus sp. A-GB7]|uniref:hypothetical protein n=1 Tax=Natronococcus sp. A-GB7 TaxID=3037649 RepID=UPI00241E135A|nr:hypothetical protein [Natronococcus sp. A-GB7]MDG5820246.1 hypothetical protein [Natronococcus sp. A-GB7]
MSRAHCGSSVTDPFSSTTDGIGKPDEQPPTVLAPGLLSLEKSAEVGETRDHGLQSEAHMRIRISV